MLDRKMNAEQSGDVQFDFPSFTVPKQEEVVGEAEDYITESYVYKNSFELVKCELGDEIVSLSEAMIAEEEIEENVEDQAQIFILEENVVKDAPATDIENILLTDDFRCGVCLQSFLSQAELNLHTSLNNPNEVHHCNYCAQSFHTKRVWSAHIETHLQSKEFICLVCLHCCSSADDLQRHLAAHHPHVQQSATRPKAANCAHSAKRRRHHRTYTCAVCNATYLLRKTLICHLRNHNHTCADCGSTFTSKERLKYHIRTRHSAEPSNVCAHCGHSFCSKSALKRHRQLLHEEGATPQHLCHICNKNYSSKSSLLAHSRLHLGQKRYVCADCGKGFTRKDRLDSHLTLTHGVSGGYLCAFCGKRISRRENLKYHLRLHTGEKPFECTVCPKSFPSQSALKKHTVIHTTTALFTCHICERTIARKDNFLAHLRIHASKKVEVC